MDSDVTQKSIDEDSGRKVEVTEREAREVAEAARESRWDRPSFAKELYLGRFDLDLVHPHPRAEAEDEARRGASSPGCARCAPTFDGARIEREAQVPDEYLKALAEIGAFGMKIPREYGGLGLTMSAYGKALMLAGSAHPSLGALLSAHQSIGVPEPVKLVGTAEQKAAFLPRCAAGADLGVPPHRARRRVGPRPDGEHGHPHRRRHGIRPRRGEAVDHQRGHRRAARRHGAGSRAPREGRGGITAFVVEGTAEGITVERRNRFMGLRGIENGLTRLHQVRVPAENRLGQRGRGAEDRAHDPQRGAAVDPGAVRGDPPSGR